MKSRRDTPSDSLEAIETNVIPDRHS
jgi:hypothetical protein